MPSFNRLLVLAVVALSASVHAAPVADDVARDLANVNAAIERSVAPAPVGDFDEDTSEDLFARELDEEEEEEDLEARDADEEEDDDELEAREVDEDEDDEDLDASDFEDEDEDSALERRAKPKTTKAAKPKTTKAAKPKTTKAKTTKVKTTKAAKPTTAKAAKTTKAKTTKAKTTAKPTTTKAAKTTKAKTTKAATTKAAKPTKSAKVTKTKASKTTKASATASACPIKKPTKPAKKTRMLGRAFDYVAHLFARDNEEFIGWHGTNSDTAAFWTEKGQLEKPTKADGLFDFLGLGPKSASGTSGADAEIGPGVYVTDDEDIAVAFANNNAKVNAGTTAQLCAIFAKSSSNWRTALRKSFIPETLVGDSSNAAKKKQLEDARIAHIKKAVPGVSATSVVKFSLLNRSTKSGQLVLPATITNQFIAKCFKADGGAAAAGTSKFPAFSYNGASLRASWNIAAETAGECA